MRVIRVITSIAASEFPIAVPQSLENSGHRKITRDCFLQYLSETSLKTFPKFRTPLLLYTKTFPPPKFFCLMIARQQTPVPRPPKQSPLSREGGKPLSSGKTPRLAAEDREGDQRRVSADQNRPALQGCSCWGGTPGACSYARDPMKKPLFLFFFSCLFFFSFFFVFFNSIIQWRLCETI